MLFLYKQRKIGIFNRRYPVSTGVPLSKVSPERIEAIRNWGKERAVPASGRPIGAQAVSESNVPKTRKVLI